MPVDQPLEWLGDDSCKNILPFFSAYLHAFSGLYLSMSGQWISLSGVDRTSRHPISLQRRRWYANDSGVVLGRDKIASGYFIVNEIDVHADRCGDFLNGVLRLQWRAFDCAFLFTHLQVEHWNRIRNGAGGKKIRPEF